MESCLQSLRTSCSKSCLLTVFVLMICGDTHENYFRLCSAIMLWIPAVCFLMETQTLNRYVQTYENEIKEVKQNREKAKHDLLSFFSGLSNSTAQDFAQTISADDDKLVMLLLMKKHGIIESSRNHPLHSMISSLVGVVLGILSCIPCRIHTYGFILSAIVAVTIDHALTASSKQDSHYFVWSFSIFLATFCVYHYGF